MFRETRYFKQNFVQSVWREFSPSTLLLISEKNVQK